MHRRVYDETRPAQPGENNMIYAAPGATGAKIAYKAQYDNFIGGKWVAPVKGQYFDVITPDQRQGLHQGRPLHRRGHRAGAGRRPRRRRRGARPGRRARQHAAEDRRPHRSQPRAAGLRRDRGQRQADPRDAQRRHPARRRPLPLLRRLLRAQEGAHQRDRREHRRLPHPRAAGRRRPDHPVELPDPHGGLEAGPGPRPPATAWCSSLPSPPRSASWSWSS